MNSRLGLAALALAAFPVTGGAEQPAKRAGMVIELAADKIEG